MSEQRVNFDQFAKEIGRNCQETEKLKERNRESVAAAQKLYSESMVDMVDRARQLPILDPMCSKLDREWDQLIQGLNERKIILKETAAFRRGRDVFDCQVDHPSISDSELQNIARARENCTVYRIQYTDHILRSAILGFAT